MEANQHFNSLKITQNEVCPEVNEYEPNFEAHSQFLLTPIQAKVESIVVGLIKTRRTYIWTFLSGKTEQIT